MEDRRSFLKNVIATAAVATAGTVGVMKAAEPAAPARTPGRRLPLTQMQSFMQELSIPAGVEPMTMQSITAITNSYLGPIVDTGGFVCSAWNISISGSVTVSGSAT